MTEELCYLIERGDTSASAPLYLGISGGLDQAGQWHGEFGWHPHAINAIRFSRRADAAQALAAIQTLQENLPYRKTIAGLRPHDVPPRVCEHAFVLSDLGESVMSDKDKDGGAAFPNEFLGRCPACLDNAYLNVDCGGDRDGFKDECLIELTRKAMIKARAQQETDEKFVSPASPPTPYERELLEILIEECSEVQQRATKALRFGLSEVQPGQAASNSERLAYEIGDVLEMVARVVNARMVSADHITDGTLRKKRQLAKYMQHEPSNG